MGRGYKWLGGIGYILSLIPFLSVVAPLLVGIAWFMAGRDTGQGVFKAAGILMMVTAVIVIGLAVSWLPLLWGVMSLGMGTGVPVLPPQQLGWILRSLETLIIVSVALFVIGIIGWVMELVAHFRAAKVYNVKWFRRAGWTRIIALIAALLLLAALLSQIAGVLLTRTSPMDLLGLTALIGSFLVLAAIPLIIQLLAIIFSAISFFSIPETQTGEQQ